MTQLMSAGEALRRIRRERRAVLLVNTRSRRGAEHYEVVRNLLQQHGFTIAAAYPVTSPATQLATLLPRILADRPPLLVVGSGDGTIATVVDHLAYTDTVLGYVPLGTTNNFGRSLELPLRVEAAVEVVAAGKIAEVDLGRVNGDVFANLVSLGISSVVAGKTPHRLKRRLGRASYALTGLRALLTHRPFSASISSGGVTWRVRTHQLNIANGRTHAGAPIAADAHIDDELLVVYTLGGANRLSTVAATVRQVLTPYRRLEHKRYLTGTAFTVTTDRPLPVDVDGEITTTTPLQVEVAPAALRVLVPDHFPT